MIFKDIAEYEENDSELAKRTIIHLHNELDSANSKMSEYARRCLEAIEYLENCVNGYKEQYEQHTFSYQFVDYDLNNILEILKGERK